MSFHVPSTDCACSGFCDIYTHMRRFLHCLGQVRYGELFPETLRLLFGCGIVYAIVVGVQGGAFYGIFRLTSAGCGVWRRAEDE